MTNHKRAKIAAAARWSGERKPAGRICVDADVAERLKPMRSKARAFASAAIRRALGS